MHSDGNSFGRYVVLDFVKIAFGENILDYSKYIKNRYFYYDDFFFDFFDENIKQNKWNSGSLYVL